MNANLDKVVCPGCGRIGMPKKVDDCYYNYICPECEYESESLLALATILDRDTDMYSHVNLSAFLRGALLATGVIDAGGRESKS